MAQASRSASPWLVESLARSGLQDREQRTLGKLVRRLTCQSCGQRPTSVIAEHAPSNEREEMLA